jgi:hypothetical protein
MHLECGLEERIKWSLKDGVECCKEVEVVDCLEKIDGDGL